MSHRREPRSHDERIEYGAWREEMSAMRAKVDPTAAVGLVERIQPDAAARRPRRLYFTDLTGKRWRVYDVSYGPPEGAAHHEIAFPPPYPPAKGRVFIAADGSRKYFSFSDRHAPDEVRRTVITPAVVTEQFAFAGSIDDTEEERDDPRRDRAIDPEPAWVPDPKIHGVRVRTSTLNRWTAYDAG